MNDLVPRDKLVRLGTRGAAGVAGGIGVSLLGLFSQGAGLSIPGIIVGGLVIFLGASVMRDHGERLTGAGTAVIGGVTVAASLPLIGGLGGGLLGISGLGLLGMGIYNLVRFFMGIKKRS